MTDVTFPEDEDDDDDFDDDAFLDQIESSIEDLKSAKESEQYEEKKRKAREREARLTKAGQDIAHLMRWDAIDWDLRIASYDSLDVFVKNYLPHTFHLDDAEYHPEFREAIEASAKVGSSQAFGVPRGGAKTQYLKAGNKWGLLQAHRFYATYVGASERDDAIPGLADIKTELSTNELVLRDFPECVPFAALVGQGRLAQGQHIDGNRTAPRFADDEIQFATIRPPLEKIPEKYHEYLVCKKGFTKNSGSFLRAKGIRQQLRGGNLLTLSKYLRRPDWWTLDDLQTDESALNAERCARMMKKVKSAVGYSGGPDLRAAVMFALTIIEENDFADQALDRDKNPWLHGIKRQMLRNMPDDMEDRIADYAAYVKAIQKDDSIPKEEKPKYFRKEYPKHRGLIEDGITATWKARYGKYEVSAIHAAVNLMIDLGMEAFWKEAMLQPIRLGQRKSVRLKPKKIIEKQHSAGRGRIPRFVYGDLNPRNQIPDELRPKVAVAIDVQHESLWWGVGTASPSWSGGIIDNGIFPEQDQAYSRRDKLRVKLSEIYPGLETPERLRVAISDLLKKFEKTRWRVESIDDVELGPDIIVVDAREGGHTRTIGTAIVESGVTIAHPSQGFGITVKKKPMSDWIVHKGKGEVKGHNYFWGPTPTLHDMSVLKLDTNKLKTQLFQTFAYPMGAKGSWSLFNASDEEHEMLADHWASEYDRVFTDPFSKRVVREWTPNVGTDGETYNEFFDIAVMLQGALASQGCVQPDAHAFFEQRDDDDDDDDEVVIEYVSF